MPDEFREESHASAEELLKALRERSDDFDCVTIHVPADLVLRGPHGQKKLAKDVCGGIKMCNGETLLIHRDDMEVLLNDGILQRMKIRVVLSPP